MFSIDDIIGETFRSVEVQGRPAPASSSMLPSAAPLEGQQSGATGFANSLYKRTNSARQVCDRKQSMLRLPPKYYVFSPVCVRWKMPTPCSKGALERSAAALTAMTKNTCRFTVDFVSDELKHRIEGIAHDSHSGSFARLSLNFFLHHALHETSHDNATNCICEIQRLAGDRSLFYEFANIFSNHFQTDRKSKMLQSSFQLEHNKGPTMQAFRSRTPLNGTTNIEEIFWYAISSISTQGGNASMIAGMIENSSHPRTLARQLVRHSSGIVNKLLARVCESSEQTHRSNSIATLKYLMQMAGPSALPNPRIFLCLVDMLSPNNGKINSYHDYAFRRDCLTILSEIAKVIPEELRQHGALKVLRAQTFAPYDTGGASLASEVLERMVVVH